MSKIHIVSLALSLATLFPAAAVAKSKISSVVVYADRAQVTRVANADCTKGIAQFEGLPTTLDVKTLRATVRGGKVLGVTWKEEVTGPRKRAKVLEEKIKAINRQINDLSREVARTYAADTKLSQFRQHMRRVWGVQARGARVPIRKWDGAVTLLRNETLAARKLRQRAQIEQRKLYRERSELYRQRQQLRRQERRTTYRATALLKCTGQREANLSYVLPGATWRINYQARADTQGKKLTLIAQAVVAQGTGEDWNNVKLSVSTANLLRKNDPPTIRRMKVITHKPTTTTKVLARRFEVRRHLGTKLDKGGGEAKNEMVQKGKKDSGLAMKMRAAGKVTVPADGREIVVTLGQRSKRADYAYETVPKLFPFVYHRIAIANPFPFPMLPGPIALYRNNTFTGRTRTKLRAPREPVKLSLGVDNQLQVHRWVKEEKKHPPSTFSSKQRLVHRYQIEVGNWTNRSRKIIVKENVPVAQVKEIEVKLESQSTKPTRWNKKDGIVSWELTIPPRSKKQIVLAYTVYVPKAYIVRGYR